MARRTVFTEEPQELSLPRLEESAPDRQQLPRGEWHFLMETEDGEMVGVDGADLSAFLKRYGKKEEPGSTGI